MGDISELELCCQQLATNKVSERKKQIEILQELLGSSHLTQQLDMNSSSSAESRVFTWDCVFRSVAGLVVKEAELMEQAENKGGKLPTSTSLNLRERKKRDCMRLLKSVIRLANKRALHLSTSALMWHIVDMLENDFTHQIFGTDYGSVLMKEVLPNRKLCCDVTSKIWNRLLHVYVLELQECEDGKRRVDRVSVTSLLYTIIGKATEHCSVHQEIIPGLSHPLKNLRQEQNQVVVEHLVCTANILCRALAADCRHMICKMGEAVFNNMLHYFTVQTTPFLKGELVEFFHIQMAAHHPCGTKSGEPGAHAHNADTWGSHLRRLYESLDNELYKYTQPSSDIGKLDERLVHLCAGVWRHVLTAFPSTIDVTQCEPSSTLMASGRHKKRRRVETGWDSMRERLASLGASERAVPWLRLLHAILARHPADLPAAELPPLLDALQQALTACKGPSVSSWLFQCLAAVAGAQVSLRLQLSAKQEATLALAWRQVWFVTLRSVAAIHRGEGLDLLSTLMRHALVTPDHKLFQWLKVMKASNVLIDTVLYDLYGVLADSPTGVTRALTSTALAPWFISASTTSRAGLLCDKCRGDVARLAGGAPGPLRGAARRVAAALRGDSDEPAGAADDAATARSCWPTPRRALCLARASGLAQAATLNARRPAPTRRRPQTSCRGVSADDVPRIRGAPVRRRGARRRCAVRQTSASSVGEVRKKLERQPEERGRWLSAG
ncbi:PREDICTED: serine-protein kinase ATM-like [Priapulus caudatus]|uniref:Serine-protein kinase ATM-like n=1 Tax=Priapulus caudatus TaxID=37621 RepID=A0ABM1EH89_PRICU|nr:PREDICTED: serine-protein kinase ATM-like [Priapulus caudatus]